MNNDIVVELSSIIKVSKYYYTMSRILKMLEHLPGNRLPTELQVLQRYQVYCSHHVFERLVNDVVTVCLGPSTSPEEQTYKCLIDNWNKLKTDD